MKGRLAASLVVLLSAMASATAVAGPWQFQQDRSRPGRIYYYERTNGDGSLDERVTVFQRDADHLEVYKAIGRCENAALVTAEMAWESLSAVRITGGSCVRTQPIMPSPFFHGTARLKRWTWK